MLAIIACILCPLVIIFYVVVNLINYKIGNNFSLARSIRSFFYGKPAFDMRQVPSGTDQDEDVFLRSVGYEVGRTIGKGAYATVKEAYSQTYKKTVAVKIIAKRDGSFDKFMRREIEVLRRVEHKNVVEVYEAIESSHKFYIVMEIAHTDLLQLLQKQGPIAEKEAKRMFKKIIQGVDYCHKKGIVHRDLKLENILLTRKCEPIISDFGFARFVCDARGGQGRIRSDTFCGSYAYAAPEILQGIPYDAMRSDTWSLGVILYTMTCGQFPFDDKDKRQLLRDTTSGKLNFPRSAVNLSNPLKNLIVRMLTPNKYTRITLEEALKHPWLKNSLLQSCSGEDATFPTSGGEGGGGGGPPSTLYEDGGQMSR